MTQTIRCLSAEVSPESSTTHQPPKRINFSIIFRQVAVDRSPNETYVNPELVVVEGYGHGAIPSATGCSSSGNF